MKRKKPVLKNDFQENMTIENQFMKVLELGLLLALRERGIITPHQFDLTEIPLP